MNDLFKKYGSVKVDKYYVLPEDEGKVILDAVDNAKHSIDIIIYEIGGPHIIQKLCEAKKRGINIRIIVNGQHVLSDRTPIARNNPGSIYSNLAQSTASILREAEGPGKFDIQWGPNNFIITHQKAILIDTRSDSAHSDQIKLDNDAFMIIMTNNLSAFGWSVSTNCFLQPCQFWGPGYPDHSAGGNDYGVVISDKALLKQVAEVFERDFSCSTTLQPLLGNQTGLIWSNGSINFSDDTQGKYPKNGRYPFYLEDYSKADIQGNVLEVFLEAINSAKKEIYITSESFSIAAIVDALSTKLKSGVSVNYLATTSDKSQKDKYFPSAKNYQQIAELGGKVSFLFLSVSGKAPFIHQKVLFVDPNSDDNAALLLTSQNLSYSSFYFARELGVIISQKEIIDGFFHALQQSLSFVDKYGFVWNPNETTGTASEDSSKFKTPANSIHSTSTLARIPSVEEHDRELGSYVVGNVPTPLLCGEITPPTASSICLTSTNKATLSTNTVVSKYGSIQVDVCYALPENEGRLIIDKINSAQSTIYIITYSFGDPNLLDALKQAKNRGVNLRLINNGQTLVPNITTTRNNDPDSFYFDSLYFMIKSLEATPGNGKVSFHWASNNFAITHQKTILIDADKEEGYPSKGVLIMTNNIEALSWESRFTPKFYISHFQFWGNDYQTQTGGSRDFGIFVKQDDIVNRVRDIFNSDFECSKPNNVTPLLGNQAGLVWTNGSTINGCYPSNGIPSSEDKFVAQGNARQVFLDVISSAKKQLCITTEVFVDEEIIEAIVSQAKKGVNVTVLMTEQYRRGLGYVFAEGYNKLTSAGGEIWLLESESRFVYLHGKLIIVDPDNQENSLALMTSQNIEPYSLDFNRELGLIIDNTKVINFVYSFFERDLKITQDNGLMWKLDTSSEDNHKFASSEVGGTTGSQDTVPAKAIIPDPRPCGTIVVPQPQEKKKYSYGGRRTPS